MSKPRSLAQESAEDIFFGQIAIIWARWFLIAAGAIIALVQTFLAGLVLAYVTQKSGKLSRAIFVHGGFNLITILVLFFLPDLAL